MGSIKEFFLKVSRGLKIQDCPRLHLQELLMDPPLIGSKENLFSPRAREPRVVDLLSVEWNSELQLTDSKSMYDPGSGFLLEHKMVHCHFPVPKIKKEVDVGSDK